MTTVCSWLRDRELEGICSEILALITMPLIAGSVTEEHLVVEFSNSYFDELTGLSSLDLPETLDVLLSGIEGPRDLEPLYLAAREKGWKTVRWTLVPGEIELELYCWSGDKHFLAFFHDLSPHEFHARLLVMKERFTQLIGLYDVKGMIPQMILELVDHMGVDWAGIFVWDGARERWMLSLEEANPGEFGRDEQHSALTFARDLSEAKGGPFGHQFGGLPVQDGARWWVPWVTEAREWEPMMTEAGFGSLFSGVLLTGSAPAVLLCLTRTTGGFARINRDVMESLWPVFLSSAERNRAVEGITKLYTRDPVSGLYAQNMIYKVMKLEMDRSRRYRYPLTAISVEVTNMGQIRETGGEEAVAETIQRLSREILKNLRSVDIGGRIGDGGVIVLLPHTPLEGAEVVSGRIKAQTGSVSPYQNLAIETEVRVALMDDNCSGPEDLLALLGLSEGGKKTS
jgi:diguanylate cyclase (GGDEF)-like protein